MTVLFLHTWILRSVILCSLTGFSSCRDNENKIKHPNNDKLNNRSYYDLSEDIIDNDVYYTDTITVQTTEKLIAQIRSNRLIKLVDNEYLLKSPLLIDSIKNLKIVGTDFSKLMIYERNATVIKLLNSHNIHLDSLIIGHTQSPGHKGEQGVLRISHSYNINISNCNLYGSGTFGLVTYDVYSLKFTNSEITECTALIFELEKSRKFEFRDSKFHNNNLDISVLGGFTNSTKEITFLNCDFLNNKPTMVGNPAFNFMDNWEDFDESIIFTNCTFKNNKGFKWYGDKIELNDCKIDSSDFIGFQRNYQKVTK